MNTKAEECINDLSKAHKDIQKQTLQNFDKAMDFLNEKERAKVEAEILGKSLKFDPIAKAEEIMNRSYKDASTGKDGEDVSFLGMCLMWANSAIKDKLLKEQKDVYFSCPTIYYQEVIEENGFKKCFELSFVSRWEKREDTFYIYWHPDGLLLAFDTFCEHINGGKIYYNWVQDAEKINWRILSSHSGLVKNQEGKYQTCGSHDCREALILNMNNLRKYGHFLNPWKKQGFIWLLHYMDTKEVGYDYKAINTERITMLPKYVQEAIKGE